MLSSVMLPLCTGVTIRPHAGWTPNEADMKSIVNIHNAVNEQSWNQVLQWERVYSRHVSGFDH